MKIKTGQFGSGVPDANRRLNEGIGDRVQWFAVFFSWPRSAQFAPSNHRILQLEAHDCFGNISIVGILVHQVNPIDRSEK
jgi:hypothetical protein